MKPRAVTTTVVVVLLLALIAVVFGPVVTHQFVNFDDPLYITENPQVRQGLTPPALAWAFTTFEAGNWHPLTWLSHMTDIELFGLGPGGHHLMNVAFHAAGVVTLFLVLRSSTASLLPSAAAALLFAIHPLRVESVAWAAERKDVLSFALGMLTLGAYAHYAKRPGRGRYLAVLLLFALGLTAKPMLVSLPFVLLLLDFWPFGRLRSMRDLRQILLEKMPLFLLAAASAAVSVRAQAAGEAVVPLTVIPIGERFANAAVSTIAYLGKTLWPTQLSIFYPWPPGGPGVAKSVLALLLLTGLSAAAVLAVRRRPYLLTGWLWYLVTLLPVVGLVQVGHQSMADRYTYLPSVGLFVAVLWLLRDVAGPARQALLGAATVALAVFLSVAAARYVHIWKDGTTLFGHALRVTSGNWPAHFSLGGEFYNQGRLGEAGEEFRAAIALNPTFAEGHFNLGLVRDVQGDADRAADDYRRALTLRPTYPEAHNNLGVYLAGQGDTAAAADHFRAALQARPDFAAARENLATSQAGTR